MKTNSQEKGQIIVILALALVAIIGITALAIDGSLIYNERRQDQNAADSVALAGAGAGAKYLTNVDSGTPICGTTLGVAVTQTIYNEVLSSYEPYYRDDFDIPSSTVLTQSDLAAVLPKLTSNGALDAADQGFTITCGAYAGLGIQYLDVRVKITSQEDTNFASVVGQDQLRSSIEATARVYPEQAFAYGNALVSLSDVCQPNQGGVIFLGNSTTYINLGGIFSNSCIEADGSSIIDVIGGSVSAFHDDGCDDYEPGYTIEPPVGCAKAPAKLPKGMMPPPVCPEKVGTNEFSEGQFGGTETLSPGWYYSGITIKNKANITLSPGLYCIYGGMRNDAQSVLNGQNVTLYFLDDSNVKFNQNTGTTYGTNLIAPACDNSTCGVPDAVQGLLMYFAVGEDAQVTLNGGSYNHYVGTIYGEDTNFTMNGGTETYTFNTQVIGNYIYISGGAQLMMDLNNKQWVQNPPSLSLIK